MAARELVGVAMTTRYFYDTEFIDDGKTIDLISIGIACEDGREYYAVNAEMPVKRICEHEWLLENVVPYLPRVWGDPIGGQPGRWGFDYGDPVYKSRDLIAAEIEAFLTGDVELWADYCAYDHVALAQLWGPMSDLPDGVPMFTNDIQTYARLAGVPHKHLPKASGTEHHALADARNVWDRYTYIRDAQKVTLR